MTGQDAQQRAIDRAGMVAAAREHSAAVALHLERITVRLREHAAGTGRPGAAITAPDDPAPPPRAALADLSRLLLADAELDALLRTVLDVTRNSVARCDGVSVTLVRNGHVETVAATDKDVSAADRLQYSWHEGPCFDAATKGGTQLAPVLPDPRWPAFGEGAAGIGWSAVLSVPLQTGARRLGALNLYGRFGGAFGPADAAVTEALAEQVAVALTNARDFQQQRVTAASLQRALLPPQLPRLRDVEFAASYMPATTGINVGGDWYDVIGLPSGRLALVIGDVAGHGLGAATTMAQLRTAVRAYALEGHEPDEVIDLVDRFLRSLDPDGYATCCYVELDPVSGALRWCNAGHPDPLLVSAHGGASTLTEHGHRPALGVPQPTRPGAPGNGVLAPGGRLLLFTDGLVERRRESLDVGLVRLARSASALVTAGVELQPWCDDVVAALLDDREVSDDVAVLAVEIRSSDRAAAPADEQRTSDLAG